MAVLRGRMRYIIELIGKLDYTQNLMGRVTDLTLLGRKGMMLTSTSISIVSATIPDAVIKEDAQYSFPEYVNLLLSTGTTVQFPITGWDYDPDFEDTSKLGTYLHEAYYDIPDYYIGTKPTVFLTMYVKPVLIISGGTLNSYTNYKSRTFLTSGTLVISEISKSAVMDLLVVGAGGSGGAPQLNDLAGGGGGAGGMVVETDVNVNPDTYTVTVAAQTGQFSSGGSSSIFIYTANGGGRGGAAAFGFNGTNGASGGGGAGRSSSPNPTGGTGISGQGNAGGSGIFHTLWNYARNGGGGGGADSAGGNGTNDSSGGGAGGNGKTNNFRTGSNVTYAAGGRGGDYNNDAASGANNTGNGGGGGRTTVSTSQGLGGSGIVVIRYSDSYILE